MKTILITGTSNGIGRATAEKFLAEGYEVYGIDREENPINHANFHYFCADLRDSSQYPELPELDYIFFNAGLQNCDDDIENNLKATILAAKKYAFRDGVKAILFNASASARNGFEFPEYVASKAGVVAYMKNLACALAPKGVTVNSISLGGVLTPSNAPVMDDQESWNKIMAVTPLKKWMTLEEVADWAFFLLTVNRSMSGQDLLIDNGENDLNNTFVWPN